MTGGLGILTFIFVLTVFADKNSRNINTLKRVRIQKSMVRRCQTRLTKKLGQRRLSLTRKESV